MASPTGAHDGPSAIARVLKMEGGERMGRSREMAASEGLEQLLLTVKLEEGAVSQAAVEDGKGRKQILPRSF